MGERVKLEMEFIINSSPAILYNHISTASGLSQWFADSVSVRGPEIMIFKWANELQEAKIIKKAHNKYIRFAWVDSEDKNEYLEIEIRKGELTEDIILYVTEFVDESEIEEIRELWLSQIEDLKEVLGVN